MITVSRIRKENFAAAANTALTKRGRPGKLSRRDKTWIARQVTSGQADNAVQVAKALRDNDGNQRVSSKTVRRALKKSGMKAIVKKKTAFTPAPYQSTIRVRPPAQRLDS